MPRFVSRSAIAGLGIAALFLAGCSTDPESGGSIVATESSCDVSVDTVKSGAQRFTLQNNGSKVTEIEFLTDGDRAVGELENLTPGTTRELTVDLKAGDYQVACIPEMKGKGIRTKLTVTGDDATTAMDPALSTAVADYRAYVNEQADLAISQSALFVAAIKSGDVARAKSLYVASRMPWERIEPVAESFGDLDPRMDARINDVEDVADWTGWHRLEKDLWVDGLQPDSGKIADQLAADLQELKSNVSKVEMTPSELGNGAQALMDEVATGKITGEEEAYSHTDLDDFNANVEGAEKAIESLRPYLQTKDANLLGQLDTRFKDVTTDLDQYKVGDTYKTYDQLTQEQIRSLADKVDALSEPLSKVTGVVTGK